MKSKKRGQRGEEKVYDTLEKLDGHKAMIRNCYLPTQRGDTTEVDLVLIHESGIYVIESKTIVDGYSEVTLEESGRRLFQREMEKRQNISFTIRFCRMVLILKKFKEYWEKKETTSTRMSYLEMTAN